MVENNSIIKPKTIEYINVLKAIGIILVVIAHTDMQFREIIYLFHVPLFYFISGYLYKDKYNISPITYIWNKVKRLYVPFVLYEIFFILSHNIFINLNIYNLELSGSLASYFTIKEMLVNIKNAILLIGSEQMAGALWFVVVLFMINIFYVILNYLLNITVKHEYIEWTKFIIIIIIFVIGDFTIRNNIIFSRNLNTAAILLIIYYLGDVYKKNEEKVSINIWIAIGSCILLLNNSNYGRVDLVMNQYVSPSFFMLNAIMGIYIMIFLSKKITQLNIGVKYLTYIGKNTYSIMALHFLAFKIVTWVKIIIYKEDIFCLASFPTYNSKNIWWVIYTLIGIAVPLSISWILSWIVTKFKNLN